jgi:hypothetical protein
MASVFMFAYLPIQSMEVKIIKEASLRFLQIAVIAAGLIIGKQSDKKRP